MQPRRFLRTAALLGAASLAGALSATETATETAPGGAPAPAAARHHRPEGGFRNLHIDTPTKGLPDLLRWRWQAWRQDLPPPPSTPTPRVPAELDFIRANAGGTQQPAVTWIGHATVLAQLGGLNLVTDPMFSERASPLSWAGPRRAQPPGLALDELPRIDLVLLSHDHYDHCDVPSLQRLNAQTGGPPLFLVPLGVKTWMAGIGITRVVELDWWQSQRVGEVEVVFTPAQHWSGRGLGDRMATLWGGFAVFAPDLHLFFAGDTGYSPDFADIAARFATRQRGAGFDLALIPVGAYEPRWFMAEQHVDPRQAVRIHRDLGARASLGIHWGTFELTDEALDQPPRDLAKARREAGLAEEDFFLLAIGQTRRLPRRPPAQ